MRQNLSRREIWKDIPGYEGIYQASTEGRIRSYRRGILRQKNNARKGRSSKALYVRLYKGGKEHKAPVHQLVARTFIGECPKGQVVCHKSRMIFDNSIGNLCYVTNEELGRRAGRAGRRPVILVSRNGIVKAYSSAVEAGEDLCISKEAVAFRCHGKAKGLLPGDMEVAWDDDEESIERVEIKLGIKIYE